jgi:PAS domain S-box-containing protein
LALASFLKTLSAVVRTPLFVEGLAVGVLATLVAFSLADGNAGTVLLVCGALCLMVAAAFRAARAEAALEKVQNRDQDERSYRSFVEHAVEGIFRTSCDGHYLLANPALARIYGYTTPEQLMGELTDIAGQLYIDPTRREAFGAALRQHDFVTDFESQIRRRDGALIWISENARAVRDEGGRLLFYEGTVEDITHRREAEDATRLALIETREAARSKAAFLAAMSHELKTPLNAVIGFSELMLTEVFGRVQPERYAGYIADIHANGKRLLSMINDILDLTRVEGKLVILDETIFGVEDVIENAVGLAAPEMTKNAVSISISVPKDLPAIRADARRMQQVLVHVLSNAVKFTPPPGKVMVRASLTSEGGLTIVIEDSGIGMAPDRIASALEPFRQIDSSLSRRFEGVGLGLPLANAFVRLHGGRLAIESAVGVGTKVTIILPPDRVLSREAAA